MAESRDQGGARRRIGVDLEIVRAPCPAGERAGFESTPPCYAVKPI
jgi:hypothetical protein